MGQVIETIGKAVTAPFKFIGDVISDPGHIGDHLQNFGSSVTGGLIPPKEGNGSSPAPDGPPKPPDDAPEWVKKMYEAEQKKIGDFKKLDEHIRGGGEIGGHDNAPGQPASPGPAFAPPPPGSSYTITVTAPNITNLR